MGINLAKLLVREDLVSVEQIREAMEWQRELDYGLGESLADLGYISESQLVELLGRQYGVPVVNIDTYVVEQDAVDLISKETALEKCLIPLCVTGSDLTIAMADPSDLLLLDDLGFLTGKNIKPAVAFERSIKVKISELYGEEESENDAGGDDFKQPARGSASSVSSTDKVRYERSVDEIITELEQYKNNQLSINNPPGREEISGDLQVDTGDDDARGDAAPPEDSLDRPEHIASEEYELDFNMFDDDDNNNNDNVSLPESEDEAAGDTDDAFDMGPVSGESEQGEKLDTSSRTALGTENYVDNEESDSEIAAQYESGADGKEEILQPHSLPYGDGEDSERVIGFAPALEQGENTPDDEKRSEDFGEMQSAEGQEVSNDDSAPDSDSPLRLEGQGETGGTPSNLEESAYNPFTVSSEDLYAGDDSAGADTPEVSREPVSEEDKEPEHFDLDFGEDGFGEIQDEPDDVDLEKQRETFSGHTIFNSSAEKDPRDGTDHFVSEETGEEDAGSLTEEELPVSGPQEWTSSVFGVGAAEELNGHESVSEDQKAFSAPAVDVSGETEDPVCDELPPTETKLFSSAEESLAEGDETGSEAEGLTLFHSGSERTEEPEGIEDLPVSDEESASRSFFSAPEGEHPSEDPGHSPDPELSVDKPDYEPLEENSGEPTGLNSPEIIKRTTNGSYEKGSVLVVDGSPTVRKIVSLTLERQGYRVYAAGDGMQALARLNEVTPDLIFVDVKLPHMDGYQLCKIIKSHGLTKDIPVVMMMGKVGILDKMRWKRAGARHYITKPFDPKLIIETTIKYSS